MLVSLRIFKRANGGGKKRLDAKTRSLINMFASLKMYQETNKGLFPSQIYIKLAQEGLNGSLQERLLIALLGQ